ncbi:MAG: hypothetical protein WAO76_03990, partial [Georgfuchsia sp.]
MFAQIVPGRLLLVIALVAAALATGFIKGALWQADKADDFKADVKAAGIAQTARSKAIGAKHQTITTETDHAHAAGIDFIRDDYRLRFDHAGGRPLSFFPPDPAEPGPGSADAGPAAAAPAPRLGGD